MAQDMEDGAVCGECSAEFEEENGFPALCAECWSEDKRPRNQDGVNPDGYQVSIFPLASEAYAKGSQP